MTKLQGKLKVHTTRTIKHKGFIAFKGLSRFDKKPIVGVITFESKNEKTGNMAQLWILRDDIEPHQAIKTGDDQSVCGGCQHRQFSGGACYVTVHQAPLSVYRSYKKGLYSLASYDQGLKALSGKGLRLGAYGDPAMLPYEILKDLTKHALFYTGYTHQWKNKRLADALDFCQASVDSTDEYQQLKNNHPSAKTFRVVSQQTDLAVSEVECLADSEGLSCATCKLCDGKSKDIAIMVHGARANKFTDLNTINVVNV